MLNMIRNCQNKTNNLFIYLFIGLFVYLFIAVSDAAAASPHLEFSPSSGAISSTGTSIGVVVDTDGQEAKSTKAVINFDSAKLEVSSIQAGTFFDEVSHNIYNSTGQVIINANLSLGSSLESKTGKGTIAAMTVKSKLSSGTAALTFDCTTGRSTDSGINDPTPLDIIVCSANVNASYSLGGGGGTTVSPSPGVGGVQASPSSLPVAGNAGATWILLIIGLGLIFTPIPMLIFGKK